MFTTEFFQVGAILLESYTKILHTELYVKPFFIFVTSITFQQVTFEKLY